LDQTVVPGKGLAAWNIPGGGRAAVYTQLPSPVNAKQLLTLAESQAGAHPGWKIVESAVRKIGGAEAMWIHLVGPGDGETLAPAVIGDTVTIYKGKEAVPTTRLWLAVVRAKDVLNVQFDFPSSREAEMRPVIDGVLAGSTFVTK